MIGGELKNVCQITILSDIGAIIILAALVSYIVFVRKNNRTLLDKIFLQAAFLNIFSSLASSVSILFVLYPEHVSNLTARMVFALKLILLELGYLCLIRYLLGAGEKKAAGGKRLSFLRISVWITCIVIAVSIPTNWIFLSYEETRVVSYTTAGFLIAVAPALLGTLICIICLWKKDKSLLSVFIFLFIMRMYLGFMLEDSFSVPTVLALGLLYAYFSVHSRDSLFQIGSIIILMFIGATLLIGNYTMRAVSSFYLQTIREENEKSLGNMRKTLESSKSFAWRVNYWIEHNQEIADAINYDTIGMTDADSLEELSRIIEKAGVETSSQVTPEDLEKLSEEERLFFAAMQYSLDEAIFEYDAEYYSFDDLLLVEEDPSGNLSVLFDAGKDRDQNTVDRCRLGEPVDREMLEYSWNNYQEIASSEYFNPFFTQYSDSFGYHEDFKVEGLDHHLMFCVSVSSDEINKKLNFILDLRRKTIFILTIVATLILALLYFTVLSPLRRVTRSVSEYQKDKNADKTRESLAPIRAGNEIGMLAGEFTSLTKEMERYTDEVAMMAAYREKVNTELRTAAQIQESVLPDTFPAFPDRTDFDLYASMDPAKEVGGDFYDFFLTDENHLAILIADVSDKGIPASLFMMSAKNLINYRAKKGGTPGQILTEINEQICGDSLTQMFVTVWMGILDLTSGVMICTNAGHEYPIIRGADGTFQVYKDRHGFVVGGMTGITYKDYELILNPGDAVFVYTDGIPEANNEKGEFYGMDRLTAALNQAGKKTPEEILRTVRADVDTFVNGANQFDDLTMLCLEYRGKV